MIDVSQFTGLKRSIALLVERRGTSGLLHDELVTEAKAHKCSVYREVRLLVKCGLLAKVEVANTTRYYLNSILSECLVSAQKFAPDHENLRPDTKICAGQQKFAPESDESDTAPQKFAPDHKNLRRNPPKNPHN